MDYELALGIIGNGSFAEFMNGNADSRCLEFAEPGKRMTDEELAAEIEETFKMEAAMIRNEPKESRNRILESILRMERGFHKTALKSVRSFDWHYLGSFERMNRPPAPGRSYRTKLALCGSCCSDIHSISGR